MRTFWASSGTSIGKFQLAFWASSGTSSGKRSCRREGEDLLNEVRTGLPSVGQINGSRKIGSRDSNGNSKVRQVFQGWDSRKLRALLDAAFAELRWVREDEKTGRAHHPLTDKLQAMLLICDSLKRLAFC